MKEEEKKIIESLNKAMESLRRMGNIVIEFGLVPESPHHVTDNLNQNGK